MIALAVLTATAAHGQAKIDELVNRIEADARKPSNKKYISLVAEIDKDSLGNIIDSQKKFFIKNRPKMLKKLEKAFAQERGNAYEVTDDGAGDERGRSVHKIYTFKTNEKDRLVYQLLGHMYPKGKKEITLVRTYVADFEKKMEEMEALGFSLRRNQSRYAIKATSYSRGPLLKDYVSSYFNKPMFDWGDFEPGDMRVVAIEDKDDTDGIITFLTDNEMRITVKANRDKKGNVTYTIEEL
jgi:hypothetical protein